jgi:peptide/nickel transport system permease protein
LKNWKLWISSLFLFVLLIIAFIGPTLPFVDEDLKGTVLIKTEEGKFLLPPFAPMKGYPLGSDHRGVDLLSLIIMGAKETLFILISVVAVRYIIAIPMAIGGFYFRLVESLLRVWQLIFSFMPPIFFMLFFVSLPFVFFSNVRSVWIILFLALIEAGRVAGIVHQHMKETEKRPYIEAGIVAGGSPFMLFKNYYLPVLIPHIIILIINDLGRILFILAQLGVVHVYITHKFDNVNRGLYEVVNTSLAWPTLFEKITIDIFAHEWIPLSAAGVIAITILCLNMIAEGLQTYFENKYKTFRSDL